MVSVMASISIVQVCVVWWQVTASCECVVLCVVTSSSASMLCVLCCVVCIVSL